MPLLSRKGKAKLTSRRYRAHNPAADRWTDAQFEKPATRIPYRAIAYAVLLFVAGTALLVIGSLMYTGTHLQQDSERAIPMLVIGSLVFIPGSYHTYMAYQAYMEAPGWTYDDIPSSFDDD